MHINLHHIMYVNGASVMVLQTPQYGYRFVAIALTWRSGATQFRWIFTQFLNLFPLKVH